MNKKNTNTGVDFNAIQLWFTDFKQQMPTEIVISNSKNRLFPKK
jgi:hypothetical protein